MNLFADMKQPRIGWSPVAWGIAFCVLICASPARVVLAEPEPAEVRLGGPEVLKMDWKTRSLRTDDLNGDGKPDMAVINNSKARIDLLFYETSGMEESESSDEVARRINVWEPTLSDAPFVKRPLVTGIRMYDLVTGDLNGDGRVDLAYTGQPDDLTVRLQTEEGTFEEKTVYEFPTSVSTRQGTLSLADVNEDGRNDLVTVGKKQLFVYVQNEKAELVRSGEYGLVHEKSHGLQVLDLNGDGTVDLVYTAPSGTHPLRMRPGLSTGGFGPERMFDIESPQGPLVPLSLPGEEGTILAYLQSETEMISLLRFVTNDARDEATSFSLKTVSPHVYSTGIDMTDARYAMGDLDGNGRKDIVAADPGRSQFLVYLQSDDGVLSEPEPFPGPNDVRSLAAADMDDDGRSELFLVSRGEELLGVSRWGSSGRMSYPESIPMDGKPLATASLQMNDTPHLAVLHAKDRKRFVSLLRPKQNGTSDWRVVTRLELSELNVDPTDLRSMDVNRDGSMDLAVFAPGSPVHFLVQKDGELQRTTGEGRSSGRLQNTPPSALHSGDLNGDGTDELFLAENNYLRSIELQENGQVKVLDQYNARSSDARITAGMVTDVEGDQVNDLLMLDERSGTLQLLQKNEAGVYRFVESANLGEIKQRRTEVLDFDRDGTEEVFVFGRSQFWKIPLRPSTLQHELHASWKMDVEDVSPSRIATGDLNGDDSEELIAADTIDSRILGVYARSKQKKWKPSLMFKVFSSDPHYKGNKGEHSEPKEIHVADVTGDGRQDLILLIHNRILVYPQE